MAIISVLAAGLLWRARHCAVAGVVLVAAAGAGLLVEGFKHLYLRSRPPLSDRLVTESSFALPSGHALGSVVVLGVLAAAAVVLVRRRGARICGGRTPGRGQRRHRGQPGTGPRSSTTDILGGRHDGADLSAAHR